MALLPVHLLLRSSNPVQKDGLHCPHNLADGGLTSNDPGQSMCTAFEERSITGGLLESGKVQVTALLVRGRGRASVQVKGRSSVSTLRSQQTTVTRGSPVPVTGSDGAHAAHWAARPGRCHPEARASVVALAAEKIFYSMRCRGPRRSLPVCSPKSSAIIKECLSPTAASTSS
jgi:hypothetical protein